MRTLDVTQFVLKLHSLFVAKATSGADKVDVLAWDLAVAPVRLEKGVGYVQLYGVEYAVTPDTVCMLKTADGGIVTDMTLPMRVLFMTLLGPLMGQRLKANPRVMAEYLQSLTWRFFQGGSVGGAVLDSGRWSISPHWVAFETPEPIDVLAGSIEDPVVRSMNLLGFKDQNAEDARKGAQCAVDPFYSLLAVGGNTLIRYKRGPAITDEFLDRWKPQLHHVGGDVTDVTSRPSTFVAKQDGDPWETDAYDEMLKSGTVMTMLQAPRVFCIPGLLSRLEWDGVSGHHWCKTVEKDFRIDGISQADVAFAQQNAALLKFAWLDTARGVRPSDGARITAFASSPMGYALGKVGFNPAVSKAHFERLTMTEQVMLMMRSDPQCPPSMTWMLAFPGRTMSRSWIAASDDAYFDKLRGLQ